MCIYIHMCIYIYIYIVYIHIYIYYIHRRPWRHPWSAPAAPAPSGFLGRCFCRRLLRLAILLYRVSRSSNSKSKSKSMRQQAREHATSKASGAQASSKAASALSWAGGAGIMCDDSPHREALVLVIVFCPAGVCQNEFARDLRDGREGVRVAGCEGNQLTCTAGRRLPCTYCQSLYYDAGFHRV